jgi:hypothetical protein
MCSNHVIFLLFPTTPFFFQEGRKVFNGAIGCNFHFSFHSLVQYKGQFPPYLKCKDLGLHHRVQKYEKAQKSFLRGCRAKMPHKSKVKKLQSRS